ncbi:N-acetylmuramoyl-L-alanine amidase [Candidatus Cardinium hertigii]|uniref:N-acetylmuramoyl-L-alanine amidase n=1 Tax=Candidatus Cardinium hertigii TaxID=247481 RepID=A0A2Z3L892_9BACT|nr:N-acetylmuramoyl-L-alanine amidase [Candidatus Cardinium hertigii]AWN81823.1 N-acetylmuramoyl-L-alanine amidase AmiD [Candidatus Cardinium hertigii]
MHLKFLSRNWLLFFMMNCGHLENGRYGMEAVSPASALRAGDAFLKQLHNTVVSPCVLHGVEGYRVVPFVDKPNRNHYDSRGGSAVKYLIMHYTVCDFWHTMHLFTEDKDSNRVSAHFVITQEEAAAVAIGREAVPAGRLIQLVPDEQRAWHAGVSNWKNDVNLNPCSLGIEHVNQGGELDSKHFYPFNKDQIHTSGKISHNIVNQYTIDPVHVLGHSDIAPGRKSDPGPLFPWGALYHNHQVGAWLDTEEIGNPDMIKKKYGLRGFPCPTKSDRGALLSMLNSYGYYRDKKDKEGHLDAKIIAAYKSHFSANQRPDLCDAVIRENDMYWAWALNVKYKQ